MLTDVLVAFDHLNHTVTILANAYVEEDGVEAGYERAPRAVGEVRERLAGPLPRLEGGAAPSRSSRPTCRARRSRRWSPGSSSTCTPATPSRSCPPSAGRPRSTADPFSVYRGLRAINPSPYMYFLDFEDFQIVGASPEPLVTVTGGRATHPADRRHPPARRRRRGGRGDRGRPARGREGAGRARDAGRPRPQRPRARVRVRHRRGGDVHGRRDLLAPDPHRLVGGRAAAARRRADGRAALDPARGDAFGRAEGAGDADHRRARAGQARRVRRRGRLPLLHGRAGHVHLHPHGGDARRHRAHAGRRRDRGRRAARLRVRGVAQQGPRRGRAIELATRHEAWP